MDRLQATLGKYFGDKGTNTGGKVVQFPKKPRPRPAPPQPSVSITGNSNIVGNGNTVIVNPAPRPRVVADVRPGEIHISDAQAARLQQLVCDIAAAGLGTHQKIWYALDQRYMVPQYRLLPAAAFEDAEKYLVRWLARAPKPNSDERKRHITFIKTNQRKLQASQASLTEYLIAEFDKGSLTECSLEELVAVRTKLVPRWKSAALS